MRFRLAAVVAASVLLAVPLGASGSSGSVEPVDLVDLVVSVAGGGVVDVFAGDGG